MPRVCPGGGGMLKLRFDWYITNQMAACLVLQHLSFFGFSLPFAKCLQIFFIKVNSKLIATSLTKLGIIGAGLINKYYYLQSFYIKQVKYCKLKEVAYFAPSGPLFLIVEYCPHGNLRDFLRDSRPSLLDLVHEKEASQLTFRDLLSMAYQITRGMSYLSSKKVNFISSCYDK